MSSALAALQGSLQPDSMLAEVQRVWACCVGEMIAAEARPVAERGGVLTIACSASVWAQELDLMSEMILERLNGDLKRGRVRRLRCTAAS